MSEVPGFDRRAIRRAFGAAAGRYLERARLQREVEAELLARVDALYRAAPQCGGSTRSQGAWQPHAPRRILDLGCGPGRASAALRRRFRGSQVLALDLALPMLREARRRGGWLRPVLPLCADASALPLVSASIDLVFSSLCIQWCSDLDALLSGLRRVLRPGGMLLLASFGPATLWELRAAWAHCDGRPRVSPFVDILELGDALLRHGFRNPVLDRDERRTQYPSARALMHELKAIGAGNHLGERPRGLTSPRLLAQVEAVYAERADAQGRIPATWEIVQVLAWAPEEGQPIREAGGSETARFSIDRLRGSRIRR